jgi:hypothetical protein
MHNNGVTVNTTGIRGDCALVAARIYIRFMTDEIFAKAVHASRNPFRYMIDESGMAEGFVAGTKEYMRLVLILEVLGTNGLALS